MRGLPGTGGSAWARDHPWATGLRLDGRARRVGHGLARVGGGTDFGLLYAAAGEIGELPDGATVLDVPCGGGVALRGVRPGQELRYVAVDIAEAMLERTRRAAARRGVAGVETLQADVGALPVPDGVADLTVSFTGLHCFPDPRQALAELARCTRPGGRLTGAPSSTTRACATCRRCWPAARWASSGPGLTEAALHLWLAGVGFVELEVRRSGALAYFRARRAGGR
jgi:SAM-dependent methyltransferase